MGALLEVRGLVAGYGRIEVLSGIGLDVEAGSYVGILGHNGMGKTTLMRALIGHLPAERGTIAFDGADITHRPANQRARLGLGYVPQGREILPSLTVLENLQLASLYAPPAKGPPAAIVARVLDDFPRLKPLLRRPGGALSGGEQQLLALARCLCTVPKLILLDEPTEGIQPSIIDEIIDRMLALKSPDLSVVLVEQNLDFIRQLADRVLIIQRGRFTRTLGPQELTSPETVGEFIGFTA